MRLLKNFHLTVLNLIWRPIELRSGENIKLGPIEFKLLATFLEKPGKVWSRDALLIEYGVDIYVDTESRCAHRAA